MKSKTVSKTLLLLLTSASLVLTSTWSSSIVTAASSTTSAKATSTYDDLFDGAWQIPYTQWGIDRGVIKPYSDNTVRVDERVTEAELMNMIANYIGINKKTKQDYLKQPDKLYHDLQSIGVVAKGTFTKSARNRLTTVDDGLLVIMSLHDNERFKNRKTKINGILDEMNADAKAPKLDLASELAKVDVLRILKAHESLGEELVLTKPTSVVGHKWRDVYFSDGHIKRLSYYEEESGLLVSVSYLAGGIAEDERVGDYYTSLTGKSIADNQPSYIVTVTNVGNRAVNLHTFHVNITTNKGKRVLGAIKDPISLNGKANQTVLVSEKVQDMSITVGNVTKPIRLKELAELPVNSFYIRTKGGQLKRKAVYVSESIQDTDYQTIEQLAEEYGQDTASSAK